MGIDVPAEIQSRLDMVEPWMAFYISAYVDLSTDTNDRGYIAWMAIDRYAQRYGFEGHGFEWLKRCIRAIENHVVSKRESSGVQQAEQQPESV